MEKLGFRIDVHRASEVGRRSLRVEGLKVSSILLTKNHAATQESTSIYQIFGRMRTEREKKKLSLECGFKGKKSGYIRM
jgi:hypothetical protein